MRLNQIRDFIVTVEAGSLRAAARSVGVSQPALTKSLRQLENELGVQLLQCSSRGVSPTRSGHAFLTRARVVQAELRRATEDLADLKGERAGAVAFGVSPSAAVLFVPEAHVRFRQKYPFAAVRVVEGMLQGLLPLLRDETLDFAVGQKPPGALDPAIRHRPLCRARLVVAGRRGHPLRAAHSLRELADASWLMYSPRGQGGILERFFSAAGLPGPKVVVHCESYAAALALLARTDTLGLVVPQLLAQPYAHGFLQQIEIAETAPDLPVGLFARANAPLPPAAAAMAAAVTAAARRLARVNR
jgi:DNA-binding transcriptional LysR family regulator